MNGIFMAYGAAVRPGAVVEGASLYDLAPTILHLMGEPVPQHMDGRVLTETLVDDATAVQRRTATRRDGGDGGTQGATLSAKDRKVLADRLRSLGYVG